MSGLHALRRVLLPVALLSTAGAAGAGPGGALAPGAGGLGTDPFIHAAAAFEARDYPAALAGFEQVARAGDAEAQYLLALMHWAGKGVPRNFRQALYWARHAQVSGYPEAEALVRRLMPVVPPDVQAELGLALAADIGGRARAGERAAIMPYGRVLAEVLVEPDLEAAYVWFSIAHALDLPGSATALARIGAQLAPDTLLAAQDQAVQIYAAAPFRNPAEPLAPAGDGFMTDD
ncbi:tetratricopeptide repeat protein [Plastorhodobacter daqingensis]|uniref:Tetratricopeptide repeat protein n=1 Tax=Plastorhodobacter daqingensis TaxID=1387281 RepID=A0ABW2UK13_9RHOB